MPKSIIQDSFYRDVYLQVNEALDKKRGTEGQYINC